MNTILNFIGGEFLAPVSGNYLNNYEPARLVCRKCRTPMNRMWHVPSEPQSVRFLRELLRRSKERSAIMRNCCDDYEASPMNSRSLESIDEGKPVWLAKKYGYSPRGTRISIFWNRRFSLLRVKPHPTTGFLNYTRLRSPYRCRRLYISWNLPLYLFTWKIAPATSQPVTASSPSRRN